MTEDEVKIEYQKLFGKVKSEFGYSLTAKKTINGWLVMKWYKRNSWVDETLEKKVLFCNGMVFENNNVVGTY